MVLETYRITVKHDNGRARFIVVSLHGEKEAKEQVMAMESCPECAIVKVELIKRKEIAIAMKAKTIDEAKSMAKEKSLETQYKCEAIYIIYCSRTEYFYVDTDSLIRLWEKLIGYYENGIYTAENNTPNI